MDVRNLTLRRKGSRRPKISAPKPISDSKAPPSTSNTTAGARAPHNRHPQNETTDLVKRRYSTRFNQPLTFDPKAPPVPSLPSNPQAFANRQPPVIEEASSGSSQPLRVDLNALKDPNLPVDKCMRIPFAPSSFCLKFH